MNNATNQWVRLLALTGALVIAPISPAQENEENGETEAEDALVDDRMTVTATRRSQRLDEIPMSVTALSSETIERGNIQNIEDVSGMTPGFSISTYNPTTPQPYIRGVGTNSSSVGDDASVGVFIDDVYAGRAGGYRTDMFDIERIEVLRGPQGSLYGRNVAGGAINVISKSPTEDFEGRVNVDYGEYDLLQLQTMASGPIADNVNGRIAASFRERDGWVDNIQTGSKLQDQSNISLRGKVDIFLSAQTDLRLTADYAEDDLKGPGARSVTNFEETFGFPSPTEGDPDKVDLFEDGRTDREIYGVSAKLTHQTEQLLFTSITAYREQDYFFLDDLTGRYLVDFGLSLMNDASEESSQITQEFRVQNQSSGPLEWTAGLYFFNEEIERVESFDSTKSLELAGVPNAQSRPVWDSFNETTSYAVFGEGSYQINDAWSVTLGGRYTYDEKDFDNTATGAPDLLGFLAENYSVSESEDWKSFTPKLTFNYRTPQRDLVYLTISEGYKAGGFNGLSATEQAAKVAFDQETARNYELGFKASFFDRVLTTSGAAFFMDYTDLQSFLVDLDTGQVRTATGDADIKGIELEGVAQLTDSLRLSGTYAYMDSEYKRFEADPSIVGNRLARTPENSASLALDYEIFVSGDNRINARVDGMYQDEIFFSVANEEAAGDDTRILLNASIAWTSPGGWEASIYGKNLTNENYNAHAFSFLGAGFAVKGDPSTVGISLGKSF